MKYFGPVGFIEEYNTDIPGVANPKIVERNYYGDFKHRSFRSEQSTQTTNDSLTLNDSLELIGDEYAVENCYNIKYVVHKGVKWRVTSVDPGRPRIVLQFGGVYREDED